MTIQLPNPPPRYDVPTEAKRNLLLKQADAQNQKTGQSYIVQPGQLLVLFAPGGQPYSVTVANDGTLSATAVNLSP
ncbi:MAG: hypothetical protein WB868_21560 [Xanthobacteraceae bacterium]